MSENDIPISAASARHRLIGFSVEALAVAVIVALVVAKLASISTGTWRSVFLANGDSLVLPLLLQSFERGEPFHWIFSSQTFFFPEFPLYAICGLIMGTPQGGLVLNAILNVVLLYAGFRAVAAQYLPSRRGRQVAVAVLAVGLFVTAMLTETDVRIVGAGTVEPTRIATLFLMTTYYGGCLLVGLVLLALVLWVGRHGADRTTIRRLVAYGVAVVVLGAAVIYSDPLFLLWFVGPLGLTAFVLLLLRRITLRMALVVVFPLVLALGAGMLARAVLARYLAAQLDQYLATFGATQAAHLVLHVLGSWFSTPGGLLRLAVIALPVVLAFVVLVRRLRTGPTTEVALALFVLLAVILLVTVQILTGQSVTRYLLALFVVPALAWMLLPFDAIEQRVRTVPRRAAIAGAASVAVAAVVSGALSSPAVADLASSTSPVDTACLDGWLAARPGGGSDNGVGSYWVTRALKLYGTQTGEVLQVKMPLSVHPWMVNLALYDGRHIDYVIVDDVITGRDWSTTLGRPASTTTCHGFEIWDYTGTKGDRTLNSLMEESVRTTRRVLGY